MQPENAEEPIVVTEDGIETEVKLLQSAKAPFPIVVTEEGRVREVKPLQFWSA